MTTGTEPCICARPIDLRGQTEIDAEIDLYYSRLYLALARAGYAHEADEVHFMAGEYGRPDPERTQPVAAEPAEAAA